MAPRKILSVVSLLVGTISATFYYPDARTSALEHLLVDTDGGWRSGFKDAITPCSNYVSGPQTLGRTTAAQWIRVAFHDFVTAHVDEGTGGIDASISFETLREENSGTAFNDSFAYWRNFQNARVSMADLVALGTTTSVQNCGGPKIPYRSGRIDATGPGPEGVPAPDTDLRRTLQFFGNAGFNQRDAIGLTACGHTMGSVHHGGFPTVVNESAVTPNNTFGGVHLDTTFDKFDVNVVTEYVTQTGQRGGPLVTSFNVSSRSDLRLYTSDRNREMRTLSQSTDYFFGRCVQLLGRMLDTVPRGVALSEPISPLTIKPINTTFDVDPNGVLKLSGAVRYLSEAGSGAPPTVTLTVLGNEALSKATVPADPKTGSSVFGASTFYPFNIALPSNSTVPSTLNIEAGNNRLNDLALENRVFFIPALSSIALASGDGLVDVNIAAAAAKSLGLDTLEAAVTFLLEQPGSSSLMLKPTTTTIPLTVSHERNVPSLNAYSIYSGTVRGVDQKLLRQGSVDIAASQGSETIVDEFNQLDVLLAS